MGIYNRVKHYSMGKPYWDIEVLPDCIQNTDCLIFDAGSNTMIDGDGTGTTYNVSGVYEFLVGSTYSGAPGNYSITCSGYSNNDIYVNKENGKIFAVVDVDNNYGYFGFGYDDVDGLAKTISCGTTFEKFSLYLGGALLYPITENCGRWVFANRTEPNDSISYGECT